MDVFESAQGESRPSEGADSVSAAVSAGRCPVDHGAVGASSLPPTVSRPRPVIPATALPGPRMPAPAQIFKFWRNPSQFMEQCRERYGSSFVLRLKTVPSKPLYVLTDPEHIKQMLMAPADVLHTGNSAASIEKFTGQSGLTWLDEDEHKVRRRQIMPSMHGKALQRIEASIEEMADEDIATWPRRQSIALHPLIHRLTLNVIREVVFGTAPPKCWDELIEVLTGMMRFNSRIGSTVLIHKMSPLSMRVLTAIRPMGFYEFLKLRTRADELIGEAIQERLDLGELGDDMLSILLGITHDDGSPLSRVELRDEMMTVFLAGTETTASAIAWGFDYLSREHEVRQRLVAEIDKGEDDTYLMATVNEVLRLRPSIPQIILREVMKPIEIGGVRFEPGMHLWASAYLMHRDPALYSDAEAFRPERFLDTKPGTYTWIPFGGGRIRCLGASIALIEMKNVFREVLAKYELRRVDPKPEAPRSRLVGTLPENGARMELRPRSVEPSLTAR